MIDENKKLWKTFLEQSVVALHLFIMLPARIIVLLTMVYGLLYARIFIKALILAYWIYFLWDYHTPSRGGRRSNIFRQSWYFRYMSQYFPIKLKQNTELTADRNYMAIFHPHGVWFFASTLAFAADVFQLEARKGLRTFLTTININFGLPLAREYLMATGCVSVSEQSLKYLLTKPEGGNMVCLVSGGSAEASFSQPGKYRILLKSRRGFCRIALQTGASLVPTFCFGEVDCFRITEPSRIIHHIQQLIMHWIGVNPVLYKGHSSNMHFTVLPKRTPITVVMGDPIPVTLNPSPSRNDIETLHNKYIERLRELFEAEKHKYLENANDKHLVVE